MSLGLAAKMLAAAMAAAIPGQAFAQQATASFELPGLHFSVPIPQGYCLPAEGAQADLAREAAALDKGNVTDLTLVACGPRALPQDYILVKTQVNLVATTLTRPWLIAELIKEFGDAPRSIAFPQVDKDLENALSAHAGKKVEVSMEIGPRGSDADCYYMGGSMEGDPNGIKAYMSVGSCMTVVGGRSLAVHFYAPGNDPAVSARLMTRARIFALSIRGGESK
jgi:hypothetical protein